MPDRPGAAAAIFDAVADAGCNVDTIIQNEPLEEGGDAEVSFSVPMEDLAAAEGTLELVTRDLGIARVDTDHEIGKVSIIGAGMRSHPGVAAKMFPTLADDGINVRMISTSPIKVSCVIRADAVPEAVRALHAAFELGAARSAGGGRAMRIRAWPSSAPPAPSARRCSRCCASAASRPPRSSPFASARSAGRALAGRQGAPLDRGRARGFDLALFSAGASTSRAFAPEAVARGRVVVDKS